MADNRPELHDIAAAFGFLTRLPVPVAHERAVARGAGQVWAWPFVGAALGAAAGGLRDLLLVAGLPGTLAALAALALLAIVTGALHEDGLADCADGLGGGRDREQMLAIMKDSRIGAFGALALVIATLGGATAIESLPSGDGWAVLAIAGALSRAAMAAALRLPSARSGGLSDGFGQPATGAVLAALAISVGLALALTGRDAIPLLLGGIALSVPFAIHAHRRLGGQTGDVLGAIQQLSHLGVLVAASLP
ncbi:MAG: adenosylcobinamide-GDP ribazoletransferase [Rubricella sp.]